jgi:hypothetical protein
MSDFALWRIDAEEAGDSNGGSVQFYAVTADQLSLPDVHAAHAAVASSHGKYTLYLISSVRLVQHIETECIHTDFVHDQRTQQVISREALGLMTFLEELSARGYRESQEQCAEHLAVMLAPVPGDDGQLGEARPLTEDAIEQAADPDEDGGWGGWLTADDNSRRVLDCEPFTAEWETRSAAYVEGAHRGAADWVEVQFAELEARKAEAAVRVESPETKEMPREILADWLDDRDDPRAGVLRAALALTNPAGA